MAHRSGEIVNLTIRVDTGVLMLAKHRALLERTTVNQHLADALEDFADGAMDAARRTDQLRIVQSPSEADLTPYQTSIRVHDSTGARGHEDTPEG